MSTHHGARLTLIARLFSSIGGAEEPVWCRPGYIGKLYLDAKATAAVVGQDANSFYEYLKAQSIGDTKGIAEMLKAEKIFVVATRGPRVRVLECDNGEKQSKIRVLDGRHASRAGWTFSKWIE
jgi:hypothetical protein